MPLKSRQLEALISERSRKTGSEVDQMMRRLRLAGKLVAGPRGTHAPALTTETAARILVTICGAALPNEAVAVWVNSFRPVSVEGVQFVDALSRVLEAGAHDIAHVLVWIDSPKAEIIWQDGRREVFTEAGGIAADEAFDRHAREIAFIGGGLLREIAEALQ